MVRLKDQPKKSSDKGVLRKYREEFLKIYI